MPRPRSWTDDDLRAAVAASTTLAEVHQRLGLVPGKYAVMLKHIRRLGLPHDHLMATVKGRTRPRRPREWSDDELLAAVSVSHSIADVIRALGREPNGGLHRWLTARLRAIDADLSHFTGQGWSKGKSFLDKRKRSLEEILVVGSTSGSGSLRRRLVSAGLKEDRCELCGLDEWQGKRLPLQLDHVNGNHADNRLENLRILCGNCHSQTETWCSGSRKTQPDGKAGVRQRQSGTA